jgi:translation initiation factor 3 subunit C
MSSFFARLGSDSDTDSSGSDSEESILSGDEGEKQDQRLGDKKKSKASQFLMSDGDDSDEDDSDEDDSDSGSEAKGGNVSGGGLWACESNSYSRKRPISS